MHRRQFLASAASTAVLSTIGGLVSGQPVSATVTPDRGLAIVSRSLAVNGKAAKTFALVNDAGARGLTFTEGDAFRVALRNRSQEETIVHWHGMRPPYGQDGVAGLPAPMLKVGEERHYDFPVGPAGTHWMHAHTLQEQSLLAAPLIVRDADAGKRDEMEIVVLLHDFSFSPASEILARLQKGTGMAMQAPMPGAMKGMQMPGMAMGKDMAMGAMDVNDIDFDAYLANERTLDDPEVVQVDQGGRVRLRIINGCTATVMIIDLGALTGGLIAVDGRPVAPVRARRFPVAMGQRLDILLTLPRIAQAWPILALREGARERTGIILAPRGAHVGKLNPNGGVRAPVMGFELEQHLRPVSPLAVRRPDRMLQAMLMGDMGAGYRWSMTGPAPFAARKGERVHVVLMNHTMMGHPIHLHGHTFQVIGLNGRAVRGAVRDTVQVPAHSMVAIAFDADNPGKWPFHCHNLYHMASGMMQVLTYEGVA